MPTCSRRSSSRIRTEAARSPSPSARSLRLREKNVQLETKLQELIQFGSENDAISEKLHRSTLALFAAPDLETTLGVLYHSLLDDFRVPQVALRLWGKVPEQSYLPELAATSQELREYAAALGEPYCGTHAPFESREWFDAQRGAEIVCVSAAADASHLRPARAGERDARDGSTPAWAPSTSRAWPSSPAWRRPASSLRPERDGRCAQRGRDDVLGRGCGAARRVRRAPRDAAGAHPRSLSARCQRAARRLRATPR